MSAKKIVLNSMLLAAFILSACGAPAVPTEEEAPAEAPSREEYAAPAERGAAQQQHLERVEPPAGRLRISVMKH